jgi:hypothetical protein
MESEILKGAVSYGIFALLFCYLLLYVLKTQEKRDEKSQVREEKYQQIISENQNILAGLTDKLSIVDNIKEDIKEIKIYVVKPSGK